MSEVDISKNAEAFIDASFDLFPDNDSNRKKKLVLVPNLTKEPLGSELFQLNGNPVNVAIGLGRQNVGDVPVLLRSGCRVLVRGFPINSLISLDLIADKLVARIKRNS